MHPSSLPLDGFAVLNDTPVACQIRGPPRRETDAPISRRRQPPPTHCGASRRNGRDLIIATRPAQQPLSSHCISGSGAGIVSRPGASAFFVSDGPISSNSGRNGGKNASRNCVSALPQRATVGCDFPHLLAGIAFCHRCRIKGLCLRSPARRLTRPLASATVGVFLSYRRSGRGYFAPGRGNVSPTGHFCQQRQK